MKWKTIVLSTMLALPAAAAPITATTVTLDYTASGPSGGVSESFSFLRSGLDVAGGGTSALASLGTTTLSSPFAIGVSVIETDAGLVDTSGTGDGVFYPSLALNSPSLLMAGPFTLATDGLTFTVPYLISGTVNVCTPFSACTNGGGSSPFSIDFSDVGHLTVTATPFGPGAYYISSAVFTTVPEPATIWTTLAGCAAVLLSFVFRRARRNRQVTIRAEAFEG